MIRRQFAWVIWLAFVASASAQAQPVSADNEIALALADMLRAGRTVISSNQGLINEPGTGKDLTGVRVRQEAIANFRAKTGMDPDEIIARNPKGKLLFTQLAAITEVLDDHQSTINKAGLGFKGFVPAVFARLVNERFAEKIGNEAHIKVTAPVELIRNRKARPDKWEVSIIRTQLLSADWSKGKVYSDNAEKDGRKAYRVLVPEYYTKDCLSCHGGPKGEIDITGHAKEGGTLGQLGGVISISLFE